MSPSPYPQEEHNLQRSLYETVSNRDSDRDRQSRCELSGLGRAGTSHLLDDDGCGEEEEEAWPGEVMPQDGHHRLSNLTTTPPGMHLLPHLTEAESVSPSAATTVNHQSVASSPSHPQRMSVASDGLAMTATENLGSSPSGLGPFSSSTPPQPSETSPTVDQPAARRNVRDETRPHRASGTHTPTDATNIDYDALHELLTQRSTMMEKENRRPRHASSFTTAPALRHRNRSSLDPILRSGSTQSNSDDHPIPRSPVAPFPGRSSLDSRDWSDYYGSEGQPPSPKCRFTFYSESTGPLYAEHLHEFYHEKRTLDELMRTCGPFWLDVTSPRAADMVLFSRVFHIHPLTEEDILTEECREKCELFRHYYFTCFHTFNSDTESADFMEPVNLFTIVMGEGILSFHADPLHHPANVLHRIQAMDDPTLATPDWINYALIDDITDSLSPLVEMVSREVESIDELVLILKANEQTDMLQRIGAARKKVMAVQRLVALKGYVIKALMKRFEERRWAASPGRSPSHGSSATTAFQAAPSNFAPFSSSSTYLSGIRFYYADVLDHIITMLQETNQFDSIVQRAHSNFLAQISLEITIASNRANDMIAKVTALGSILLPMNVITGLFGMNVHVPGNGVDSYAWFGGIIGSMVLILALSVFCLHKFKIF
ncbi:CorA metal ion transporter [Tieghemiomyces parasiticus]|uniref:CorA metal ion transporter n=1 Tax=Tieghemiomyces parasiticus TaxID=78921 RepID=A0A9W8AD94_9FUNG|nr:CorA metal ion transporter [Tieghemiomyces parasiticus]